MVTAIEAVASVIVVVVAAAASETAIEAAVLAIVAVLATAIEVVAASATAIEEAVGSVVVAVALTTTVVEVAVTAALHVPMTSPGVAAEVVLLLVEVEEASETVNQADSAIANPAAVVLMTALGIGIVIVVVDLTAWKSAVHALQDWRVQMRQRRSDQGCN